MIPRCCKAMTTSGARARWQKPCHRALHDTLKVERDCENRRLAETPIKIIKTCVCQKGPDTTRQPGLQVIDNTRLRTPPPHQLTTARRGNPRRAPCGRP